MRRRPRLSNRMLIRLYPILSICCLVVHYKLSVAHICNSSMSFECNPAMILRRVRYLQRAAQTGAQTGAKWSSPLHLKQLFLCAKVVQSIRDWSTSPYLPHYPLRVNYEVR